MEDLITKFQNEIFFFSPSFSQNRFPPLFFPKPFLPYPDSLYFPPQFPQIGSPFIFPKPFLPYPDSFCHLLSPTTQPSPLLSASNVTFSFSIPSPQCWKDYGLCTESLS